MPKNVVVLSDGTGNSAAKLFRTNVWRFYQALDLSAPTQIARYEDGVGSSSFKPLAALASAVGFGLKRNVLELYMFLCRNYEPGDQIYVLGFSRGAFTVRVLLQFIFSQELVKDFNSDKDLRTKSRRLYRRYRKSREKIPPLVWVGRAIRWLIYDWAAVLMGRLNEAARRKGMGKLERRLEREPKNEGLRDRLERLKHDPWKIETQPVNQIRFVGVWDTVDDYVLPIPELKRGVDMLLWPLALEDRELDSRIEKACHALAIDDKRATFHPFLRDEHDENLYPDRDHTDDEKLTQVWFAGMHANIGGGYPDDGMSYVPLRWMVAEARKLGLQFKPSALAEIDVSTAIYGRIYDSRSGRGVYYRYNPRRVDRAIDSQNAVVRSPKIHESVIWRMTKGNDAYAPLSLPKDPRIVTESGRKLTDPVPATDPAHRPEQRNVYKLEEYQKVLAPGGPLFGISVSASASDDERCNAAERIGKLQQASEEALQLTWDTVWWRRLAYFTTLSLTLILAALPLLSPSWLRWTNAGGVYLSRAAESTAPVIKFAAESTAPAIKYAAAAATALFPSMFKPWIDMFVLAPLAVAVLVFLVLASLRWGISLDRSIHDRALATWNENWLARRYDWIRRSWDRRKALAVLLAVYAAILVMTIGMNELTEPGRTPWLVAYLLFAIAILTTGYWLVLWLLERRSRRNRLEFRGPALWIAHGARKWWFTLAIHSLIARWIVPTLFALLLLWLAVALVSRLSFAIASTAGFVCGFEDPGEVRVVPASGTTISTGEISHPCQHFPHWSKPARNTGSRLKWQMRVVGRRPSSGKTGR